MAYEQFKVDLAPEDRAIIRQVAEHFQRSQTDTVRLVFRELYQVIQEKHGEGQLKGKREQKAHVTA